MSFFIIQDSDLSLKFSEYFEKNTVLENLCNQRELGKFCDIILHVQGKKFPAHRSVLAASSPYFESILKNHRITKEEIKIYWQNVKTFEILLNYMYTGSVIIDKTNVYDLLRLSNYFLIEKLKNYVEQYLQKYMDVHNCLNIKQYADSYNLTLLQDASIKLIRHNIVQTLESSQLLKLSARDLELFITDTDIGCNTLPRIILLNAITSWVKVDLPNRSNEFQRLLNVISFKKNDVNDILEHIHNETLYQESKLCLFLILQVLITNEIAIGKDYFDQYNKLRIDFEDLIQNNINKEQAQDLSSNEVLNNPINIEPIEVVTRNHFKKIAIINKGRKSSEFENNSSHSNSQFIKNSLVSKKNCNSTNPIHQKFPENKLTKISTQFKQINEINIQPVIKSESKSCQNNKRIQRQNKNFQTSEFIDKQLKEHSLNNNQNCISNELRDNCKRTLAQWKEGIKCPHCVYVGHSATKLEQHLAKVHEEGTIYKCMFCEFTCKWNKEYYNHMKSHYGGPPYKCKECDYICDKIQFIILHKMRHTNKKVYRCGFCSFKTHIKNNFIVHLRTHSEEKKYKCQFCQRCFSMKNSFDQHLITHYSDKSFFCDSCDFVTKYEPYLTSHRKLHAGNVFHCQQPGCNYFSARKSQLSAHMRTHLSIRSHICSTCGKGFIEKSHLIRHERIHLEEKPFKCEICDYGSTRRDKLKEHIMRHHSDKDVCKTLLKSKKTSNRISDSVYIEQSSTMNNDGRLFFTSPQDITNTHKNQDVNNNNITYSPSSLNIASSMISFPSNIVSYRDNIL